MIGSDPTTTQSFRGSFLRNVHGLLVRLICPSIALPGLILFSRGERFAIPQPKPDEGDSGEEHWSSPDSAVTAPVAPLTTSGGLLKSAICLFEMIDIDLMSASQCTS